MDSLEFMSKAKELVCTVYNNMMGLNPNTEGYGDEKFVAYLSDNGHEIWPLTDKDVYVVWLSKTLQNGKAMLSTTRPDGMYYEVTYNGDKKELYVDAYKKVVNRRFGLPKEDQQDEK